MRYTDEIRLIKQLRRGNEQSFEKIYGRYHRQLYAIAVSWLKDEELAEDAVQEVFLKLWTKKNELDPSRSLKNYLAVILKNHVLNMIRNAKRRILKNMEFDGSTTSDSPIEDQLFFSEYQRIVENGLDRLPAGKQQIFRLRRFEGMSNSEVAEKLGISILTVKSQFYQATKFIREYLEIHAEIHQE